MVVGLVSAGSQPAPTLESLCRTAIEATLESRGHTDIDVGRALRITDADGAKRVSGAVTSVDESGHVDAADLRCVIRVNGESMRVVSARLSD